MSLGRRTNAIDNSEELLVWFKTRVGLSQISEPLEIRAYRADSGNWTLAAQFRSGPDTTGRTLFGKINMSGPWFFLAKFRDDPGVQEEIGRALDRIAEAAQSESRLCDLSEVGHTEAWEKEWLQIAWPHPK
jgi:hypothetical protein